MGVAPGYDDLIGVAPNPLLHVDAHRLVCRKWKTKERAPGLRRRLRQILEIGRK